LAARAAIGRGVVATVRQPERNAKLLRQFDDLRFCQPQQRRVDLKARAAFHACFGGEIRHALVGLDVLGAAIRVARIIERVDADKDIGALDRLRQGERVRKEDRIACGHVSDRNARRHLRGRARFGHVDGGGERRSAEDIEAEPDGEMLFGAKEFGNACGRGEFLFVALSVVEGERVAGVSLAPREGEAGRGIESAAEQAHSLWGRGSLLGISQMRVLYNLFLRIRFLTSTPLDVRRGSGTYVGIHVLRRALEELGHSVTYETPQQHFRIYTLERLAFNRGLRASGEFDLTVGFDMDGYRIARAAGHVASLKGVIADEVRFESGLTRLTMGVQARCERLHVQRASRVLVTSAYSAAQAMKLYSLRERPTIVPELIDLAEWRRMLAENPVKPRAIPPLADARGSESIQASLTVLYVGRFYRRKRVNVLLSAAAMLRNRIPELAVRIVGNGPCDSAWRTLSHELRLKGTVTWLGDVSRAALAEEYNRADAFCLPSVQEGFGIVLLEAMAAGKPIVAARAAAIPEVAPHAVLVEPDNAEALAAGIERVRSAAPAHPEWVKQFDAKQVAYRFLEAVERAG
jgi:glycosyltransferase involved in cell wall biosynthesis